MFILPFVINYVQCMLQLTKHFFKFVTYVFLQATFAQLMWLWIYEYCNNKRDCLFRNYSALNDKPMYFTILFLIYLICDFQVKFSSNRTPKILIGYVRFIYKLCTFSLECSRTISSLLLFLWKTNIFYFRKIVLIKNLQKDYRTAVAKGRNNQSLSQLIFW